MLQEGELKESETEKSNLEEWEDTGLYWRAQWPNYEDYKENILWTLYFPIATKQQTHKGMLCIYAEHPANCWWGHTFTVTCEVED